MDETVTIDARFRGPPESGNGGYVCGRLAALAESPVTVRLLRPPPLDTPLRVEREGDHVRLVDGDTAVAEAFPAAADLSTPAPPPPSFEAATEASRGYAGFHDHPYPTCFVCGPERADGDGLRIFAGPVPGGVAAPFVPGDALAGADGTITGAILWAALDCPGAFTFELPPDRTMLLGEMTAGIDAKVHPGEKLVAFGWEISHEGRKHRTGTALYRGGVQVATARATWIEVPSHAE